MLLKALATIAFGIISIGFRGFECKESADSIEVENAEAVAMHINETAADGRNSNGFDKFSRLKKIRMKSPTDESQLYEIDMIDLIRSGGRSLGGNHTKWNKFLLLLIVGLKLKSMLILSFVAILALKGFLAGTAGLFVAKAIGWELYYRTDRERARRREREEYEERRRRYYSRYPAYGYYNYFGPNRYPYDYEYKERNREKPIVIYLNDGSKSKREEWHYGGSSPGTYRRPTHWSHWENEYPDYGK